MPYTTEGGGGVNAAARADWRVAGGSSGGSALAVATGVAAGALGSDTGGSTRIPAAWCGVPGLKPSYGRLSRHGLIPLVNRCWEHLATTVSYCDCSLDCPGLLAGSVADLAVLLDCTQGLDPLDSTSLPCSPVGDLSDRGVAGMRVGVPREFYAPGLSEEAAAAWSEAAGLLEAGGATVVPVSLPHTALAVPTYSVLNCCEVRPADRLWGRTRLR